MSETIEVNGFELGIERHASKFEINRQGSARPFLLLDGWALQQHTLRSGHRHILGIMLPGEAFVGLSEYSILSATNCRIGVPNSKDMNAFREAYPPSKGGVDHLRTVQRWMVAMGGTDALARVAFVLVELASRLGVPTNEAFEIPLTQAELGDVCSVTSVHLNRTLRKMDEECLVRRNGRTFMLIDEPALRRLADYQYIER